MTSEEERLKEMEERWEKEWGPEVPASRKWILGILFLAAFFGILAAVMLTAEY